MVGSIAQHSITNRKEQVLKRKNFLPTLIVTIILWILVGGIIYFVEPETLGAIPVFFAVVFFALLFTFSLVFANTRRGFITALGVTAFLVLRYLGIGNILNFLFIAGLAITIEFFFLRAS